MLLSAQRHVNVTQPRAYLMQPIHSKVMIHAREHRAGICLAGRRLLSNSGFLQQPWPVMQDNIIQIMPAAGWVAVFEEAGEEEVMSPS